MPVNAAGRAGCRASISSQNEVLVFAASRSLGWPRVLNLKGRAGDEAQEDAMGGVSIWHWIVVGLIVMLLFGRGKISEMMGDVAKGIKAFKKGMAEDEHRRRRDDRADPADPSRPSSTRPLRDAEPRPRRTTRSAEPVDVARRGGLTARLPARQGPGPRHVRHELG